MNLLINVGLFTLAFILGVMWVTNAGFSLVYGLPRSVAWIARGKVRTSACLPYLCAPVFWAAVFVFAGFILGRFFPQTLFYLNDSAAFLYGQWFGVIAPIFYAFSKSGRQSLNEDFFAVMERFKI